ncbi:hypothetical protein YC2023_005961 [Brassica napus]
MEGSQNEYEESSEWFVKYLNRQGDWLEKTRGNLMVAATVIAGMSFQVMVSPPGGVWENDNCPSGTSPVCKAKAGTSQYRFIFCFDEPHSTSHQRLKTQEPADNGDTRNIYGSSGSLNISSVFLCRRIGSVR